MGSPTRQQDAIPPITPPRTTPRRPRTPFEIIQERQRQQQQQRHAQPQVPADGAAPSVRVGLTPGVAHGAATAAPTAARARPAGVMPEIPKLGLGEHYYQKLVRDAEAAGDDLARAAAKVAAYVTLGLDPKLRWPDKARFFRHALDRYGADDPHDRPLERAFRAQLRQLVRDAAGEEALRLAIETDDMLTARKHLGQPIDDLVAEAEAFFNDVVGPVSAHDQRPPPFFGEPDWMQLRILRDQWV